MYREFDPLLPNQKENGMPDLYDEVRETLKKSDELLDAALEIIEEKNNLIATLDRNTMVLMEIIHSANDTFIEYNKIIGSYHKAISQGEITQEDIKEYKENIQRAIKNHYEVIRLQNLYNKVSGEIPDKDGPWGVNVNAKVG